MANKNIQIKHFNGTSWDSLFPKTKAFLVDLDDGTDLETKILEIMTQIGSGSGTDLTIDDVKAEIVGLAPADLNTLKKLADALGNDPNFSTAIQQAIENKVSKDGTKILSTNDFTDIFKTKLETIEGVTIGGSQPSGGLWLEEI